MTEKAPIRITQPTIKVAAFLADLKAGSTWGLQICSETQLGSGSVYSVLDRFESYGWVESFWEEDNNRRGARRRLYKVTSVGKKSLKQLVAEKESISILIQSRAKVQA
jgi:DNA-binding PadR family transcriptional regulator